MIQRLGSTQKPSGLMGSGWRPDPAAGPLDDQEPPAEGLIEPGLQASMGHVGERTENRRMALTETFDRELGGTAAARVGGMHAGVRNEALGIGHRMPLAPVDPLATIIAAFAAGFARLGRLAVDDGCRRLRLPPASLRARRASLIRCRMPARRRRCSTAPPSRAAHAAPRWAVLGWQAPGEAAAQHVENRIRHRAPVVAAWSAAPRRRCGKRCQDRPFGIAQLGWVSRPTRAGQGGHAADCPNTL
jgi:hypothetical protein